MKINGFNINNYRYFYFDGSENWSDFGNLTYGELRKNDIVKLSNDDLAKRLFSSNYYNRIKENIYPHDVIQYPVDKPFNLYEYLCMQEPITFKEDGVLSFIYDCGEFAYINNWMRQKMNSDRPSKRLLSKGNITEENDRELNLIHDEEISNINDLPLLDGAEIKQFPQKFKNIFKFKNPIQFELEYNKGETWSLMNISVFLAVFNQDFIRLLANSTEILDQEKARIFVEEYKDNIPKLTRRYYKVKNGIKVKNISQVVSETSIEHFNRNFSSLVVRSNTTNVSTCNLNRDNFYLDGCVKYFYVNYRDNLGDGIAENEISKIAYRVPYQEALEIEQKNSIAIKEEEALKAAIAYVGKHRKSYEKFCKRNPNATCIDFMKKNN